MQEGAARSLPDGRTQQAAPISKRYPVQVRSTFIRLPRPAAA
jgi:hypothetical protein